VVVGCVIGSNLLLLVLLWACFARCGSRWQRFKSSGSRRGSDLYAAERSQVSRGAEREVSQVEFNVR
jgi:hypothetical protein